MLSLTKNLFARRYIKVQEIRVSQKCLTEGTTFLEQGEKSCSLQLSKHGAGILLPQLIVCKEHLLTFYVTVQEEHSLPMHLLFYVRGEEEPALEVRFGLLPGVKTMVCFDLNWLDARELFPEAMPGTLKIVCHGRRIDREEIVKVVLSSLASFHDVQIEIGDIVLTDEYPEHAVLQNVKLVDCFGQNKHKKWNGKTENTEELKKKLQKQYEDKGTDYPFKEWTAYGGWKKKKLKEGTGFFSSVKEGDKWWLTDPLGYAYFSMEPDCVGPGSDCRIDGVEKWLDWLPDRQDAEYGKLYYEPKHLGRHRKPLFFSFTKANLYRVFGESWYEKWKEMITGQLKKYGMNTLGSWSDGELLGKNGIPYVTSLPEFPATTQNISAIFRMCSAKSILLRQSAAHRHLKRERMTRL